MHDSEHDQRSKNDAASGPTDPAGTERDEIMSRLPRSRPQRRNYRRAETPQTAPRVVESSARPAQPAGSRRSTPQAGLAELTLSGAYEVAKLPLKVGAQATFRALDAVARSLRSR